MKLAFKFLISLALIAMMVSTVYATFPGANGKIVFSRNIASAGTPAEGEIFTVNPDGSGLTQLTFTGPGLSNTAPRWSADGKKIVFMSFRSGNFEVWAMNADGSGQTQITHTTPPMESGLPAFSPDGSKIVFARGSDVTLTANIWVMSADGSNPKQLSNLPTGVKADTFPAWSPDGSKIAFERVPASIIVMNADGTNPVDITKSQPNSDTDSLPNWQPLNPRPVGGVALPVNKLALLTPYLALAGLVAAVSAVVVVKKRRD